MDVTLQIPDAVARRLGATPAELSRRALEALGLEEYQSGHLSCREFRQLLGFETGDQLDEFLKAHNVWVDYTLDDLERERSGLQRLGF